MMSLEDRVIASELRVRVAAEVPVVDLVVFGSRARGDAATESDLDVFIVVDEVDPPLRRRISEIAWEIGYARDRVICTVVATRAQLHGALGASSLLRSIRLEGVRP